MTSIAIVTFQRVQAKKPMNVKMQEFLQRFETEASGARERVRDGKKLQHVLY